jgi:hypothetical protein
MATVLTTLPLASEINPITVEYNNMPIHSYCSTGIVLLVALAPVQRLLLYAWYVSFGYCALMHDDDY